MTTQPNFPSRRALLGGVAGSGAVLLIGAAVRPAPAQAAPTIVGCSTWGAKPAREGVVLTSPLKQLVVHHTDSPNSTDTSVAHAYSLARSIQQSHFSRGFIDSGQHLTISRGGHVLEGRHRTIEAFAGRTQFPLGAHTYGVNTTAFGIENEGNYMLTLPPIALWKSLVQMCAHVCRAYRVSPDIIAGHRDFGATDCPGDKLYAKLPALRSEVRTTLAARTWGVIRPGASGAAVRALQYLLRQAGRSVTVDGGYDSAMTTVVKAYQTSKGLFLIDGIVGAVTWESGLTPTLRERSTATNAVRALQTMLTARGHTTGVDGNFGSGTLTAAKAFQSRMKLNPDGVVGLDTWSKLLA